MLVAISKQRRRAFMVVAIILWLTILPLLLLYASGYRINPTELKIEQTGSLLFKSYPRSANVFVDNKQHTKKTPALLNTMQPGLHSIEIAMDKRHSWNISLLVEPKKTLEYSDVLLFLKDQSPASTSNIPEAPDYTNAINSLDPELQFSLDSNDITAKAIAWRNGESPIVVYDDSTNVLLVADEVGTEFTLHDISHKAESFDWLGLHDILVYNTEYEIYVVDSNFDQQTILRQGTPIRQVKWHPRGGYIIFATDSTIEILETRLTDSPNRYTIYSGAAPSNISINSDGTLLYFSTPDKQSWELPIL